MIKWNYFNPRPPQGERQLSWRKIAVCHHISIYAPRKGSDTYGDQHFRGQRYFNPRPPQGERLSNNVLILLTHYFNPRPPQGERLSGSVGHADEFHISIHAPRKGSD